MPVLPYSAIVLEAAVCKEEYVVQQEARYCRLENRVQHVQDVCQLLPPQRQPSTSRCSLSVVNVWGRSQGQ
jgi:hypothetical protein